MRISEIELTKFRRFEHLKIIDVPESAKLVVLCGPNGTGKSSLFDAFLLKYRMKTNFGWSNDAKYFHRPGGTDQDISSRIQIQFHNAERIDRGSFYIRTAHRHDPEFTSISLTRQNAILDDFQLNRMIESDALVVKNYNRLSSQAMEDLFVKEPGDTTIGAYRERIIGEIQRSLQILFPDLVFIGVGNPLDRGSFVFRRGTIKEFDYKNLSGGEKAAFDLILDFIVRKSSFPNAIYCLDEPELHMNTRVQGALLSQLFKLLPDNSQMWIASHSIGMMKKARDLFDSDPKSVVFLDFDDRDFDRTTIVTPSRPTRSFWQNILKVSLDELSGLVAPSQVIICEGDPSVSGRNSEYDARIYSKIFSSEFPDVIFISAGSSNQVVGDFFGLAAALPKIASGIKVKKLIDLDDHAPADIDALRSSNVAVLGRRTIESYLYDDEILEKYCISEGKEFLIPDVLAAKAKAVTDSKRRGNPADDIKSAAGTIYADIKRILSLTQVGNSGTSFAQNVLAPLITPETAVYRALKADIFS